MLGEEVMTDAWLLFLADWRVLTLWIILIGCMIAFILAFAVGANDSANSWGTTVGAGTITLRTACILGSIFETLGAVFLSGNVIKKVTTGIIDITLYETPDAAVNCTDFTNSTTLCQDALQPETQLMLGAISTMLGSSIWQLIATYLAWPVSGTHAIVCGLLGFTLVANGLDGVVWFELGKVIFGWIASPILAALFTALLYIPLNKYVLPKTNDVFSTRNMAIYAALWGLTVGFDVGTIMTTGDLILGEFDDKAGWEHAEGIFWGIAGGVGLLVFLMAFLIGLPLVKKRCKEHAKAATAVEKVKAVEETKIGVENGGFENVELDDAASMSSEKAQAKKCGPVKFHTTDDVLTDTYEQKQVFQGLQVLSACTGALAHGGNDVGNAIGPFVLIYLVYENPLFYDTQAPYWLLLYGGIGIGTGLFMFGSRVIQTMGTDMTPMTPSRGFCVNIMAAITVIIASIMGLPVSTTHCQVGSVMASGLIAGGPDNVDLSLFGKIAASWGATIPFPALMTAFLYWLLSTLYLPLAIQ